jgi:hypothetical protein
LIKEGEGLLFMDVIIGHSIIGIEVGTRNSFVQFIHKSNFVILKNKIDKEARKRCVRMRKMPLTKAGGKKNKTEKDDGWKRRKLTGGIRQQKLKKRKRKKKM